jgi:hypothetical protein
MSAIQLAKARLVLQTGNAIEVQFNPVSLNYEVSNSLDQQNRDATRRQIVTQSNARLSLELQFDSTPTGKSVREQTLPIKRLLRPDEADTQETFDIVPPLVRFEWGSFIFSGLIESYRETLDFFSPEGVPLRAQVSIAMTHQTRATEPPPAPRPRRRRPAPAPAVLGRCTPQGVDGAAGLGQRLGGTIGTGLARGIAQANGEESLRRSDRTALAVPESAPGGGRPAAAPQDGDGRSLAADVGQRTPLSQALRFDD